MSAMIHGCATGTGRLLSVGARVVACTDCDDVLDIDLDILPNLDPDERVAYDENAHLTIRTIPTED